VVGPAERERALERIREICLGLPETSERPSHGAPAFFVRGKKAFVMVLTDHHGDARFALWCAAPAGMQGMLVESDRERFFVPPYVGHRGWVGVRLDRGLDWETIAAIAEDAYAEVAPAKLVEAARLCESATTHGADTRRGEEHAAPPLVSHESSIDASALWRATSQARSRAR
jgi:hypothetical protein